MERNLNPDFAFLGTQSTQKGLGHFDLANWGMENVAYVKSMIGVDGNAYGIFAADGTELAQMDNREEAIVTIRQNDLEPLSVH
jgi:hypothetical protein